MSVARRCVFIRAMQTLSIRLRATASALVLLTGLALVPSAHAQNAAPADDPVIATVDGLNIRRSDFARAFRGLPQELRQRGPQAVYGSVLDRLIEQRIATKLGRDKGLANDEEVKARLKAMEGQVIFEVYVEREARARVKDADVKKAYQDFLAMNPPVPLVKARHLVVATEEEARRISKLVLEGKPFTELAKQYSTSPSAAQGGDLGWFRQEEMIPEIGQAAFALQPNQFTADPVKTQYGWHLILVEDRRTANPPELDAIKDTLADRLAERAAVDVLRDMVAKANVKRFDLNGQPLK